MKTIYWFKPAHHWNVVTEEVYEVLSRFYSKSFFKITKEKKVKK